MFVVGLIHEKLQSAMLELIPVSNFFRLPVGTPRFRQMHLPGGRVRAYLPRLIATSTIFVLTPLPSPINTIATIYYTSRESTIVFVSILLVGISRFCSSSRFFFRFFCYPSTRCIPQSHYSALTSHSTLSWKPKQHICLCDHTTSSCTILNKSLYSSSLFL